MRQLYVDGMPLEEIAGLYDIDLRTVYYHRKRDEEQLGTDWDQLRVDRKMGDQELEARRRQFLGALLACFDEELEIIQDQKNPENRLKLLERYTNAYTKIMATARKTDPGIEITSVVAEVLHVVADLAIDDNPDVARFILDRMEDIQAMLIRKFA